MTLILAWVAKGSHIAIACDGKAIQWHADGSITPVSEHCSKLHQLTPDIVLAVGGDGELGHYIQQAVKQPIEAAGENLFEALEYAVPFIARAFVDHRRNSGAYAVPRDHSVLLLGWDADAEELRGVGFDSVDDWSPAELRKFVVVSPDRQDVAVDRPALKQATPEQACELLAGIIRQVAAQVPERVNGNVSTYVILDPSKEPIQ